jgi:large subunit ribosomal protein L1
MTDTQIRENIVVLLQTLIRLKPSSAKGTYIRGAALSSTMGVGVRLETTDLIRATEAL